MVHDDDYDAEYDRMRLEASAVLWFVRVVGFLTLLLLGGLLALALTACGGGDPEPAPDLSRYPTERNR